MGIFWICYFLFIVAILLIPVYRNLYYIRKYKMSLSEHSRQIIDSFCENNTCIYVAEFCVFRSILLAAAIPLCIIMTAACIDNKDSKYYLLFYIVINVILHAGCISLYMDCLYEKFLMTNTFILNMSFGSRYVFEKIPLHDVAVHMPYASGFGHEHLKIITKDWKILHLMDLKNREQLIDALKKFTNSTEEYMINL